MTQTQTTDPNRGTGRTVSQLRDLIYPAFLKADTGSRVSVAYVTGSSREFPIVAGHLADLVQSCGFGSLNYERRRPMVELVGRPPFNISIEVHLFTTAAWPEAQRTFAREVPYAIDHAAYRK